MSRCRSSQRKLWAPLLQRAWLLYGWGRGGGRRLHPRDNSSQHGCHSWGGFRVFVINLNVLLWSHVTQLTNIATVLSHTYFFLLWKSFYDCLKLLVCEFKSWKHFWELTFDQLEHSLNILSLPCASRCWKSWMEKSTSPRPSSSSPLKVGSRTSV